MRQTTAQALRTAATGACASADPFARVSEPVHDRCRLGAGDHFAVDDDPDRQTVTLRKVQAPGRWLEVYMQCPHSFELPPRRKEFYRSTPGLAG